jgi:prepilin-type N-terminal cleavage/methylation domain-containing protein
MNHTQEGHTLIEVMIVIVLIVIVAALTVSNVDFLQSAVVKSEMHKLYALCRSVQHQAQARNTTLAIPCDTENNSYTFEGRTFTLPHHTVFGFLPGAQGPPSSPSQRIKNAITFNNNCITCSPHGILSSGTVYMLDTKNRSMYALSCGVATVSYIRLYRYLDGGNGHGTWFAA